MGRSRASHVHGSADAHGQAAGGNHFSCSMSAVLLAEVVELCGAESAPEVLRLANSSRSVEYLSDITNWISFDEAVALWRAATLVTHDPNLPQLVGQRAAQRLASSPVAALLRSLGSPEAVYREITTGATKFSTVVRLEALETRPGFARIVATPVGEFTRSAEHCAWTMGMLSAATVLFGMPLATVEHSRCAAFGAPECSYEVSWGADGHAEVGSESADQLISLRRQLEGMQERLHSMFETAADLIAAEDIDDVLARITDRAAGEVRAPRFLLAVRMEQDGALHCHHRGFDGEDVTSCAERILASHDGEHPPSWLVVPVRSRRRD